MTLKQLEAFHLAATLGSFALAAERAHVTQSSLSKRIAELEEWAGAELFDRTGRKARLSEAGQRLLPVASRMLGMRQEARAALDVSPRLIGTCRLGVSELGALTWLPDFVARLQREHPSLVLKSHVGLGRQLERQVARGELDCAVVPGFPERLDLASYRVDQVAITWVAAPERIPSGATLDVADLAVQPVITMDEGSALTQVFDMWAAAAGLRVQRVATSNSLMATLGLTMSNVGLSFLPKTFIRPWIERGELVEFQTCPGLPELPFCFLHRQDDRRAMLSTLHRGVTEMVQYASSTVFHHVGICKYPCTAPPSRSALSGHQ